MASITITNTFVAGTTILAAQVNTNFTDVSGYINARNAGSTDWDFVSSLGLITAKANINANVGSAANPPYTFTGDTNTGLFWVSADAVGISTSGGSRMTWENSVCQAATPISTVDGTAGSPAMQFTNDTDAGLFLNGAGNVAMSVGGTNVSQWTTGGLQIASGVLLVEPGSAAAPSVAFDNDTDTGIYRVGSDSIGFTAGGNNRMTLSSGGLVTTEAVRGRNGLATLPAFTFDSDPDSGLFRIGANNVGISTGGSTRLDIQNTVARSTIRFECTGGEGFRSVGGSEATPSYSWTSDSDTGMYRNGANSIAFTAGGTRIMSIVPVGSGGVVMTNAAPINSNNILPNADNTNPIGTAGLRYSEIFAAIGTINTSHSTTKYDIEALEDVEVPEGVTFKRKDDKGDRVGRTYVGYLNDSLPDEARPIGGPTQNYENAVTGILCNAVRKLQNEIKELKNGR